LFEIRILMGDLRMAFRRALILAGVCALAALMATPSYAQEKRKLNKDETTQYESLHALVDAVSSGKQPAPADVKVTMHNYFLLSGGDVYIPFTLDLNPAFSQLPVGMYVRAVAKTPPAAAQAGGNKGKSKVSGGAPASGSTTYAFEDIAFYPDKVDQINRALELPAGDYDIYVAMSERPSKDKKAPAPKSTVAAIPLTVPNLTSGLATSSIILAKGLEPSGAQLNGQQQLEQPYTISGFKISPAFVSSFPKSGELLWVFYIYNEGAAANGKPDLNVEYNFFHAGEDKPFVNMPPSAFNATTLPAEFDLTKGHTVFVGQGVPLTTFNPGDYKVEMKITDKTNSQSLTRTVNFTVTP
jgi:hypothetical protein